MVSQYSVLLTCRFVEAGGASPAEAAAVDPRPRQQAPVAHGVVLGEGPGHTQTLRSEVASA